MVPIVFVFTTAQISNGEERWFYSDITKSKQWNGSRRERKVHIPCRWDYAFLHPRNARRITSVEKLVSLSTLWDSLISSIIKLHTSNSLSLLIFTILNSHSLRCSISSLWAFSLASIFWGSSISPSAKP